MASAAGGPPEKKKFVHCACCSSPRSAKSFLKNLFVFHSIPVNN